MKIWKTVLLIVCTPGLFGQSFEGPVTGVAVPGFEAVDGTVETLLAEYQVPGAALAISYQGRLIYARGFGYGSTATSTPVQPDSLFRTASVSKEFTAAAVLKLIEHGTLTIDQPAFALVPDLQPAPGQTLMTTG
jgi:CubicO group peptidase (beta-lactamase class C family)